MTGTSGEGSSFPSYINCLDIPLLDTGFAREALETLVTATPDEVRHLDALIDKEPDVFALSTPRLMGARLDHNAVGSQKPGVSSLGHLDRRIQDVTEIGYHTVRLRNMSRFVAPELGRGLGLMAVRESEGAILFNAAATRAMQRLAGNVAVRVWSVKDAIAHDAMGTLADDEELFRRSKDMYPTPVTFYQDGAVVDANYLGRRRGAISGF